MEKKVDTSSLRSEVPVPIQKNTPTDYVCVRISIVHVKKVATCAFFKRKIFLRGLVDVKEYSKSSVIPDDSKIATDLFNRLTKITEEYGVTYKNLEG